MATAPGVQLPSALSRLLVEPTRYRIRASFNGVLNWICPDCGKLNRSNLSQIYQMIRCKQKDCKHKFSTAALLVRPVQGQHQSPAEQDNIIELGAEEMARESFPETAMVQRTDRRSPLHVCAVTSAQIG